MAQDKCQKGEILLEEIEDHKYEPNESLLTEKSQTDRVLITKTNNVMFYFVENLLKYYK